MSKITTKEELKLINAFSRKELKEDEVFTFNLTLCDNDIDRDFECFSLDSLQKLKELFVGKTGISDHSMRSKDQAFRIFRTYIEKDENKKTAAGEPYVALKAKAYTVKTEYNASLIAEIDGGIKKEVSVSCNAEECICSLCGKDMKLHECKHIKGRKYGGKLCYGILKNPTDAYEWSFVAVPAQRKAGVTKSFQQKEEEILKKGVEIIKNAMEETVISASQAKEIKEYIEKLEAFSKEAQIYKQCLVEDIEKYALIAMPLVNSKDFIKSCENMALSELKSLKNGLKKQAAEKLPATMQLKPLNQNTKSQNVNNNQFQI